MSSSSPNTPAPVNHVLVDYENVHEVDFVVLDEAPFSLVLLLGAKQKKLDADLVEKLLAHADAVQLVRLTSSGKNALDLAVAYYLGQVALTDPMGIFHIISKDTGFDPLIKHLRGRRVDVRRHNGFSTLGAGGLAMTAPTNPKKKTTPATKKKTVKKKKTETSSKPAKLVGLREHVVAHLHKNTSNRPRKRTTLVRHLLTITGTKTPEDEIENLIDLLVESGELIIGNKGSITYRLS